jgi:hypothetical protein
MEPEPEPDIAALAPDAPPDGNDGQEFLARPPDDARKGASPETTTQPDSEIEELGVRISPEIR